MLRKVLFTLGIAILMGSYAYGQNATIKGKVTETDGKTPVEFANVALLQDGQVVTGAVTGEDGSYNLSPIASGTYDLRVSYVGFQDYVLKGLVIQGNITKIQDVQLGSGDKTLDVIIITAERPIFEPGDVTSTQRMNAEEINQMPGKSVDDLLSTMSGVTKSASGTSVRGGRPGEQTYMVDGATTTMLPPRAAMAEFAFIQGAIPAEYGSASVIEIETKGFSRVHRGTVEATGSVDGFNNFSLNFGLTGPIAKRKDRDKTVYIGYMLSGAASYGAGGNVRGGTYRASQETIDYLIENPLRRLEAVTEHQLNYITKYQEGEILSLEEKKGRRLQNAWSALGNLTGKIDIKASDNVDLMLKGSVRYSKNKAWDFVNSLFNSVNNPVSEDLRWDVYARFTHRIKTDPNSIVKNVYYRLYGYYSRVNASSYSDLHKDNLFEYGYIGKFDYSRRLVYRPELTEMEIGGQLHQVVEMVSRDVAYDVAFTPFEKNKALANYTIGALDFMGPLSGNQDVNLLIQQYNGLLNGQSPPSSTAYGLFSAPGMPHGGNTRSLSEVINPRFTFSFDIKNHSIKVGAEYHQNISRYHGVSPYGLWSIMRDLANNHILELDLENPIYSQDESNRFIDTVSYNRIVNSEQERQFSKSIREKMGLRPDEWVDIDKYDPSTYSLDMFSPEDLFNNGSNGSTLVSYYGFDYTGKNKTNKPITMADMENWFNGDAVKRNISTIGAYKPIRISAYIQDKFGIKSLFFDLGLRLDIYDKNQPVVKDMYLLRDAYTVKEALALRTFETEVPDMIKESNEDYYVYVKDLDATSLVVTAYRKGNTWYDANGVETDKPDELATASGNPQLLPFLKTGENIGGSLSEVSYNAFADYKPTFANGGIALSPRIAFAFTVAENSKFTASYNIITNENNSMLNPLAYLYFDPYAQVSGNAGRQIGNPGLKPDRSIDYQIGFEQAISKDMKIDFTAYYSEKRDQVQAYHYTQAYPQSYFSYINMDFGTVQGFVLGLTMRRVKNLAFNGSYTIQFAKGTGSTAASTLQLIRSGAPNLRTLTILSYDQRHKINLNMSYVFGLGEGPKSVKQIKNTDRTREIKWLQAAGAALTFSAGSGLPYTQSSEPYSTISGAGQRVVKGKISGSRMPWIFDCNLNIFKGFPVVLKNSDDARAKKMGLIEVSFEINNLFEFDQINSVYSYTGSATDDGYLTAAKFQQDIARNTDITSYQDYYSIRMEGINRLGGPRTFNLTLRFEF